jgi:predicted nuclease of predicted toxin-antitoxin system
VRLLFDQNLARRLVAKLAVEYPDSTHVADLNLDTATDRAIWEYAGAHNYVIASKDTDFRQLAFLYGPRPRSSGCESATSRHR